MTPTPYQIKGNKFKFMDLEIRIELTRVILLPGFSVFFRNSTIHFSMFLYLETCFWESRFRGCAGYKLNLRYMFQFIPIKLWKGDEIVLLVIGTATKPWLSGNMLLNIKTCVMHGRISHKIWESWIKIARVNSILITKSINLQLFTFILYCVGSPLWCWYF